MRGRIGNIRGLTEKRDNLRDIAYGNFGGYSTKQYRVSRQPRRYNPAFSGRCVRTVFF